MYSNIYTTLHTIYHVHYILYSTFTIIYSIYTLYTTIPQSLYETSPLPGAPYLLGAHFALFAALQVRVYNSVYMCVVYTHFEVSTAML